jgi:plasmid stability protein
MTSLTINLPTDVYQRLEIAATQQGKPAAELAQEWLAEKSTEAVAAMSERDRVRAALRAAGLLAELSPEEKHLAAQSTLTLEEARAILDRTAGKPLSEIILEMRGPKE